MSYYQGDYGDYGGYYGGQGDIFGFVKKTLGGGLKLAGTVAGAVGSVVPGVGGILQAGGGIARTIGGAITGPTIAPPPPPGTLGGGGIAIPRLPFGPRGQTGTAVVRAKKDGMGMTTRKRPRMNYGNVKALRRADRRIDGFVKTAKSAMRHTNYKVVSKSAGKAPKQLRCGCYHRCNCRGN